MDTGQRRDTGRRRWSAAAVGVLTGVAVSLPCTALVVVGVVARGLPPAEVPGGATLLGSAVSGALVGVTVYTGMLLTGRRRR